jgi:hypothetical protein
VTNTSNDLTFDPVEPPVEHFYSDDLKYFYSAQKKNDSLTVSMKIHKGAIFDSLKIKLIFLELNGIIGLVICLTKS